MLADQFCNEQLNVDEQEFINSNSIEMWKIGIIIII
jgi:hypothetical protein